MSEFYCAGYYLTSKFDSGNLNKVEQVEDPSPDSPYHNEIRLWTRPDCGGTQYENVNRSWFFFGISGGEKCCTLKLTVMNLNKHLKLFEQGMVPVVRISDSGPWERLKDKPTFKVDGDNFMLSFLHRPYTLNCCRFYYAFTYPYTYSELLLQLDGYDKRFAKSETEIRFILSQIDQRRKKNLTKGDSKENARDTADIEYRGRFLSDYRSEIYYHRELLIKSVEGRRIDLLTITSFDKILEQKEELLPNLFVDETCPRCNKFSEKKIIFISSRVHPGETPSSFVLNGFLNLILSRSNLLAQKLRKMYVFKIVPFLNPDGVFHGMFRSDTLGQNLNRFYQNPNLENQPAIYAVRKLIRFYHFGVDLPDIIRPTKSNTTVPLTEKQSKSSIKSDYMNMNHRAVSDTEATDLSMKNHMKCAGNSKSADSLYKKNAESKELQLEVLKLPNEKKATEIKSGNQNKISLKKNRKRHYGSKNSVRSNSHAKSTESPIITAINKTSKLTSSYTTTQSLNISADFSANFDVIDDGYSIPKESNMFLYVDLHGHSSKKGNFMYGNYLPNVAEAVECMLLPKLMAMNCAHFHFDSCVFTEKNMYQKGKRDGLSKEGSGRVAMYKTIGLIKSYTLESNYNTGKCVNALPVRRKETVEKKFTTIPPKYTPLIFEEVGRALGPSILDLTNSNPLSRIQNSEYQNLMGIRNSLKFEVEKNIKNVTLGKSSLSKIRHSKLMGNIKPQPKSDHQSMKKQQKCIFNSSPWEIIGNQTIKVVNSLTVIPSLKDISKKSSGKVEKLKRSVISTPLRKTKLSLKSASDFRRELLIRTIDMKNKVGDSIASGNLSFMSENSIGREDVLCANDYFPSPRSMSCDNFTAYSVRPKVLDKKNGTLKSLSSRKMIKKQKTFSGVPSTRFMPVKAKKATSNNLLLLNSSRSKELTKAPKRNHYFKTKATGKHKTKNRSKPSWR